MSQFASYPPVGIVRFIDDRGWLAKAGEVVELAGLDGCSDLVLGNDLDRTVGKHRLNSHECFDVAHLGFGCCAGLRLRCLFDVVEVVFQALSHGGIEHHITNRRHQFGKERASFQAHLERHIGFVADRIEAEGCLDVCSARVATNRITVRWIERDYFECFGRLVAHHLTGFTPPCAEADRSAGNKLNRFDAANPFGSVFEIGRHGEHGFNRCGDSLCQRGASHIHLPQRHGGH